MAEAFGVAAGAIPLAVLAYETSKLLYEEVSCYKSQRPAIKNLQTDLDFLVTVTGKIKQLGLEAQSRSSQEEERFEPLCQPLECCRAICQEMLDMLNKCKKNSKEEEDTIKRWLKMRFHEKDLEGMVKRLAWYKSTLSLNFDYIQM